MENEKRPVSTTAQTSNRVFTREESEKAFGRHPDADWKYVKPKKRGRKWMKKP